MSLPKNKAEEILDLCMSDESPQMRAKVYEVISLSGIQPNDPMFLILALTGQIRVLLEVAPSELRELLEVGKSQLSQGMNELNEAISLLKKAQELQIENIKQSIEEINAKNLDDLCNLHKSLVGEILYTNINIEENLKASAEEIKNTQQQLKEYNIRLQSERNTNVKVMKSLIEGLNKTTTDLDLVNSQISSSVSTLDRLKLSKFVNSWMILGSFISISVFTILLTLGLLKLFNNPQHTGYISTHRISSRIVPMVKAGSSIRKLGR